MWKTDTPNAVRKALSRVANLLLNEEIDVRYANSFTMTCNAILNSLRTDEQDRKLAELERLVMEGRK